MTSCICGQSNFTDNQYIVCGNCQRPYTGPSVSKSITNSHRHNRNEENSEMQPIQPGTPDFISYLKKNSTMNEPKAGEMKKMRGQQLSLKELIISGFDKPILIETKDGLEVVTDPNFTFDTLMQYYPVDHCVEVNELTRQIKVKVKMTHLLAQFAIYPADRQDIFVLKLDLTQNSKLTNSFNPPRIVRKLSWVDQYWPNVPFKPLLSKYCFISMENSYTNFHIDIGGASAWYHVIQGEQTFYFIEPTNHNLEKFQEWIKSPNNEMMFFTHTEKMFKTKVSAGETIFIPNGWIYAILSMQDSITFGGYFLHSMSISTQLTIYDFIQKLNQPELEFPSYELTNWYAAPNILKLAKESFKNQPPKHLSEGIEALIEKLRIWLNKSKSKRHESLMIVPKAVNCSKIVRDLNHCLRNTKRKSFASKETKEKVKTIKAKEINLEETEIMPVLDPEETRIKDLVKPSNSNSSKSKESGSSVLKLTVNMKLAQDVIRRSLDDPYDLNSEQNEQDLMLIESTSKSSKSKKKRKRKEEEEIAQMIEGRRQDENYIYLDLETPEENKEAIKKSDDKMWEPGTSGKKIKTKVKKIATPIMQPSSSSKLVIKPEKEKQTIETPSEQAEKIKKHKKGHATPKQRLAKKLKMSM